MSQIIPYRKDIEGLRAFAVLAVIFFHLGLLPNGYLGVDVFFVISGYLITSIINTEISAGTFSLRGFYLRRIRRILPMIFFVTLIVLVPGMLFMLPDDLENLSQSVIATNFFGNNFLQLITTGDYWDLANEYKPLMHTWSLGIEEQFYLIYPLLFLGLQRKKMHWILPVLILVTVVSLGLLFLRTNQAYKFYLLPFRFFELATGGIMAVYPWKKNTSKSLAMLYVIALLLLLGVDSSLNTIVEIVLATAVTAGLLTCSGNNILLENNIVVFLGKISFSLYLWHQVIIAYFRYAANDISYKNLLVIFPAILLISALTYHFIEEPFRKKFKTRTLLITLFFLLSLSTGVAAYLYSREGVIRDVPELEIKKGNLQKNKFNQYTDAIFAFDKKFENNGKIKVLVVGNSFARDWANVLLESGYDIDLSYSEKTRDIANKASAASVIFVVGKHKADIPTKYLSKIWCIGSKKFGVSNGIFYNKKRDEKYCTMTTPLDKRIINENIKLQKEWGKQYIGIIEPVMNEKGEVPVFSDCKFISYDCKHLTSNGAKYFATVLDKQLKSILIKK
ncbi:MAG: acyltransferase family protein [Flavobacteriales bacterium]